MSFSILVIKKIHSLEHFKNVNYVLYSMVYLTVQHIDDALHLVESDRL